MEWTKLQIEFPSCVGSWVTISQGQNEAKGHCTKQTLLFVALNYYLGQCVGQYSELCTGHTVYKFQMLFLAIIIDKI